MKHSIWVAALAPLAASPALALDCDAGFRAFTHLQGESCIPENPQRIVSLGSKNVTVPMIELGVMPVGSQGTLPDGGQPTIRASATSTGVDFGNSDIAFVGDNPVDLEAVAALNPDLIIWPDWQDEVSIDQLELIAPTITYFTDSTLHEAQEFYAALFGKGDALAANRARYDAQIAQLASLVPDDTSYAIIHGGSDGFWTCTPYGNLDLILQDAGLNPVTYPNNPAAGDCPTYSAEELQAFDADWVFTTYRTDRGQIPQDAIDAMEGAFPGFCDVLSACQQGRLIPIPREEITTPSYDAVGGAIFMLTTVLSNPFLQPE
ncbi:ABC transporter substrate-binding protein [Cognatiyoonia sp. IB215182]|uniref:ABC transporter substrate-binding protein n=1 Tax=Cognatiyoonia sp. IB215182 TaxID=3097353 RepID=UPI002A165EEB|nr:ABC transporter substrate-binding protein [Cognatiyoonia sp. IB215182]MDX8354788.1 ABC transporter substrate-binding protein [Cognatiyoonia sp. IB215182]